MDELVKEQAYMLGYNSLACGVREEVSLYPTFIQPLQRALRYCFNNVKVVTSKFSQQQRESWGIVTCLGIRGQAFRPYLPLTLCKLSNKWRKMYGGDIKDLQRIRVIIKSHLD